MIKTLLVGRKAMQVALSGLCLLLISTLANAIDTPQNPRGSVIADGTVKWEWDWVPGADRYDVIVDGQYVATSRDPNYTSRNLWVGEHSLQVKAIDGSWNYSSPSNTFKLSVGQNSGQNNGGGNNSSNNSGRVPDGFAAPGDPRGTEVGLGSVRWEWNSVSGASQYEITIDGQVKQTTAGLDFTSQNLWAGDHSMTIRAVDSNNNFSGRSATAKIEVRSWFDSNNPSRSYTIGQPEPTPGGGNSGGGNDNGGNNTPAPPPPPPANDNGMIDPASWSKPNLASSEWQLSFSDEFDAWSLNGNRWHGQLRWGGDWNGERYEYRIINAEDQMYVNPLTPDQEHRDYLLPRHNPFQFNGSSMAIRAIRNPLREGEWNIDHGPLRDVARQQHFLSGAISTYDKFTQKYGRFEARMKIPGHVGTFPAFWLYHQNRKWEDTQRTEIDIMENLGHAPQYIYNSFHYHTDVSASYSGNANFIKPSPSGQIYTGTDYSQDFHTYAVEWSPGYVAWFIDGEKVSEMWNSNVDYEELYMIINLAMGGNWTNYPTNSGGLGRPGNERYPAWYDLDNFNNPALEIDFVRVYRRR